MRLEDVCKLWGKIRRQWLTSIPERQRIAELKKALNERERLLKQSFERLQTGMEDLKESESLLDRNVHMHQKLFHQLNRVKKELIADLFSIYPIEQVSLQRTNIRLVGRLCKRFLSMMRNSFEFVVSICQILSTLDATKKWLQLHSVSLPIWCKCWPFTWKYRYDTP